MLQFFRDLPDTMSLNEIQPSDIFFFVHLNHPFIRYLALTPAYRILYFQVAPFSNAVFSFSGSLLVCHYHPGLADKVEAWDVATPLTWERYTGNWRGSYEGWLFKKWDLNTTIPTAKPNVRFGKQIFDRLLNA